MCDAGPLGYGFGVFWCEPVGVAGHCVILLVVSCHW